MGVANGGASGDRIEVEPEVLIRAGKAVGSLGEQLGALSDALGAALGSGIASGTDPPGLDFGLKYGRQAQQFADTVAQAANAYKSVGYILEATGYNYKNADAASTIGGRDRSVVSGRNRVRRRRRTPRPDRTRAACPRPPSGTWSSRSWP